MNLLAWSTKIAPPVYVLVGDSLPEVLGRQTGVEKQYRSQETC